jgi:hypothetical protein
MTHPRLRAVFGFDFPDDLFRFWEFANRFRPLQPRAALADALGVVLVGPFDVLAGCPLSAGLPARYAADPPEFFTALEAADDPDALHWGYYLDDPATGKGCVASWAAGDVLEITADGNTLFEAVRLHLEGVEMDCRHGVEEGDVAAPFYRRILADLAGLREALMRYATGERPEAGEAYLEKYEPEADREQEVVAATLDGMGIVVPPQTYRPLSLDDTELWDHLWQTEDPAGVVEEARAALAEGYPGTALKLGKDLWAVGEPCHLRYARELLRAAYRALGREVLCRSLGT